MEPKFRIPNIVPNMSEGVVTAFYVWDDGAEESFRVPIQNATLEGLMQIGWDRQAWYEERAEKLARLLEEAQQAVEPEVTE